jgi:hypothetical protein
MASTMLNRRSSFQPFPTSVTILKVNDQAAIIRKSCVELWTFVMKNKCHLHNERILGYENEINPLSTGFGSLETTVDACHLCSRAKICVVLVHPGLLGDICHCGSYGALRYKFLRVLTVLHPKNELIAHGNEATSKFSWAAAFDANDNDSLIER